MAESLESELEDIFKDVQPDLEDSEELKEPMKLPQGEEKPPKPELKPLPPSLKYAFLGEGDMYIGKRDEQPSAVDKIFSAARRTI